MTKETTLSKTTLKQERMSLLLEQQDLAERAGLNARTVRNAERGIPISIDAARSILAALNEARRGYGWEPLTPADLDWNIAP